MRSPQQNTNCNLIGEIFFSCAPGVFSGVDHILGYKLHLDRITTEISHKLSSQNVK